MAGANSLLGKSTYREVRKGTPCVESMDRGGSNGSRGRWMPIMNQLLIISILESCFGAVTQVLRRHLFSYNGTNEQSLWSFASMQGAHGYPFQARSWHAIQPLAAHNLCSSSCVHFHHITTLQSFFPGSPDWHITTIAFPSLVDTCCVKGAEESLTGNSTNSVALWTSLFQIYH